MIRIPPGTGDDTNHPDRINGVITRLGDHPIHEGLPRTWMTPTLEVYRYARGPAENVQVLSYAHDPQSGVAWPWNGSPATARGGLMFRPTAMSGRATCSRPACVARRCRPSSRASSNGWLAGRWMSRCRRIFPTDKAVSIRPEITIPPKKLETGNAISRKMQPLEAATAEPA